MRAHAGGLVADAIAAQARASPPASHRIGQRCRRCSAADPATARRSRRAVGRRVDIDLDRLRELGLRHARRADGADRRRIPRDQAADHPQRARPRPAPRSRPTNLVMVTSALPGEGKTFTAINLAISVAMELDSTVLLVDGDVAHPALPDLLGVPSVARPARPPDAATTSTSPMRWSRRTSTSSPSSRPARVTAARPSSSRASRWRACCASSPRGIGTASSSSIRRRCSRPRKRASSRRTWDRSSSSSRPTRPRSTPSTRRSPRSRTAKSC